MTGRSITRYQARTRGRGHWGLALRVAEFAAVAALLVLDFEFGARLRDTAGSREFVVAALATAFVAIVVAVLALARRHAAITPTVITALSVSMTASIISAIAGSPLLSLTETAALLVLVASAIRSLSPRGSLAVGIASFVVVASAVPLREGYEPTLFLLSVLVWGCAVAVGALGRSARMRREVAFEDARRAERMELARELHDVVAHQVTGIVVQAQAAVAVARSDPDRMAESLAAIEAAGSEALLGMRRMVGAIRQDADDVGAPRRVSYRLNDVPALVDRFDPGGGHTSLHIDGTDESLPPALGETAYRVIREALTNVRKHASRAHTRISVKTVDETLTIEVVNDGVDPASAAHESAGFGLTGIAERIAALDGSMYAGADEPDSWVLRVSLPLRTTP